MDSRHRQIIKKVTEFYFKSGDFNGIALENLFNTISLDESVFKSILTELIIDRSIDLVYEGDIPNPHIKPFPANPVQVQLEKLKSFEIKWHIEDAEKNAEKINIDVKMVSLFVRGIGCCVYPTPEHLRKTVDWKKYVSQPFTLRLAMGEWQLRPYFFELSILAIYRNDPRYRYQTDDITGSLYSNGDGSLNRSDDIMLAHFYFGFDQTGVRAVAVLLTDLQALSPQHQQIWRAKMLPDSFRFGLHPDARQSILGHFPNKVSIFSAFRKELEVINEMTTKIKGMCLMKKDFQYEEKPENFGFLILPTLREYESFCHTLDRMMSENINEEFFDGEINQFDLRNGQELDKIRGITKLDIWITKSFDIVEPNRKMEMIKTFRDVRELRSKPAHIHLKNEWSLSYYHFQRKLIYRAYTAIRTLRLILAIHPDCDDVKVSDWLYKGQIRDF